MMSIVNHLKWWLQLSQKLWNILWIDSFFFISDFIIKLCFNTIFMRVLFRYDGKMVSVLARATFEYKFLIISRYAYLVPIRGSFYINQKSHKLLQYKTWPGPWTWREIRPLRSQRNVSIHVLTYMPSVQMC